MAEAVDFGIILASLLHLQFLGKWYKRYRTMVQVNPERAKTEGSEPIGSFMLVVVPRAKRYK